MDIFSNCTFGFYYWYNYRCFEVGLRVQKNVFLNNTSSEKFKSFLVTLCNSLLIERN